MNKYLTILLIVVCGSVNLITAQTTGEKAPLPQWWLYSSLADSIDRFLFHVEGQYSYSKMSGSIEGETQSGAARVAIRKNIFTNHTEYMIDKMNLMLQALRMNYVTESQVFTNYLDVDLTRLLFGEVGFIWERDHSLLIKNRYSFYAGLGLNGLIFEKHYLKVLAAIGRIDQDYTIPVDNINVIKGAYTPFYMRQQYKYIIDQTFSVTEFAYYLADLNDADRYRMGLNLSLNILIVKPVSLVLSYAYKFDKESELLGAIPRNTTQTIGVNVSL
jgi:hypothetical protein